MAIIVERVTPGSLAEKSDLQAGDRLVEYAGHPLASPATLKALEEKTFGQETVRLMVERDGQHLEILTSPGTLEVETVLPLPASVSQDYEAGRAAFEAGQFAEAAGHWNTAASQVEEKPIAAWLYSKARRCLEKTVGLAAGADSVHSRQGTIAGE